MTAGDRNVEGQTTAITVFSTVKPWGRRWLPILFWVVKHVPSTTAMLRKLSFIHFARWALIRELAWNGPPQLRDQPFHRSHLFFESNFNGSWGEYIDAFSYKLTKGMAQFWGSSYGFPGALPTEPFKAYIRSNETEADHYYSAYPDATSTTIQRALKQAGHTNGQSVTPFMCMTPIRPDAVEDLATFLRHMDPGPLAKIPETHMGRFVIIHDFHAEAGWGKAAAVDHLHVPYLVFTSNFDGPVDAYLDKLTNLDETVAIYALCMGVPDEWRAGRSLADYLRHNAIAADVYFAAYAATVAEIHAALAAHPPPPAGWVSKTPRVRIHIARAIQIAEDTYDREYARCPAGTIAKRDQHADEYGTIRGQLHVRVDAVPVGLRHGLFARNGSYDVAARFSPNAAVRWPLCPPAGVALTVYDVPGSPTGTQTFLFGAKVDRFFCRDAEDAVDLVQARADGRLRRYVFPSLNPRRWRRQELRIMTGTLLARTRDLLAGTTYFSQTPIGCGPDLTVKVSLTTPNAPRRWPRLRRPALAAKLREHLETREASMVLRLQRLRPDEPVNDPRQRTTGAWEPVATLRFPPQAVGDGEHMAFTLEDCHPDHDPRGEIAETRVGVYHAISAKRHAINHADRASRPRTP